MTGGVRNATEITPSNKSHIRDEGQRDTERDTKRQRDRGTPETETRWQRPFKAFVAFGLV